MSGFVRHRRSGLLIATFNAFEAELLRSLAGQIIELLQDGEAVPIEPQDPLERLFAFDGPIHEPDDPVLIRLLPSAYPDDAEASGEFRRFTESGLREGKVGTAVTVLDALRLAGLVDGPPRSDATTDVTLETYDVELSPTEAVDWLKSLTDFRLAIAARLGVEEDGDLDREFDREDPRAPAVEIYHWLSFVQETLVRALRR